MDNIVGGRCSVSLITQLRKCIFLKNKNIFRHLKLEIASAIPASNDEKYNSNNLAGQGLRCLVMLVGRAPEPENYVAGALCVLSRCGETRH